MKLKKQFQKTYQENYKNVIGLCLGYVNGDEDKAKDLSQEVFIKVWENLETFRNEAKISTWIYRITVNICLLNNRRKQYPPIQFDLKEDDSTEILAKENQFQEMYRCIGLLSEKNKSIILLELEDVPQFEIAEVMGISHQAIRTRINRIKNELSKCVCQ